MIHATDHGRSDGGIINRSRRGKMKLLINYNIYIIIAFLLYDTIDRSEYESEKERWIRERWIKELWISKCLPQMFSLSYIDSVYVPYSVKCNHDRS